MVLVHFDTMASTSAGLQPWPATVEMGSVGSHPLLVRVAPLHKWNSNLALQDPEDHESSLLHLSPCCSSALLLQTDHWTKILPSCPCPNWGAASAAKVLEFPILLFIWLEDGELWLITACHPLYPVSTLIPTELQEPWSDARDRNQELCFWWACSQTPAKYNLQIQSSYVTLMWP